MMTVGGPETEGSGEFISFLCLDKLHHWRACGSLVNVYHHYKVVFDSFSLQICASCRGLALPAGPEPA
jgi:hypothetical protein